VVVPLPRRPQGVLTSDEVQEILKAKKWEQHYPLMTTINRIINGKLAPGWLLRYTVRKALLGLVALVGGTTSAGDLFGPWGWACRVGLQARAHSGRPRCWGWLKVPRDATRPGGAAQGRGGMNEHPVRPLAAQEASTMEMTVETDPEDADPDGVALPSPRPVPIPVPVAVVTELVPA
jgi:hypothetical protein